MKLTLAAIAILLPTTVFAADGLTPEVIKTTIYQAINLTILIAAIIYFAKDGVKKFFADRRDQYLNAAKKSEQAREEAEKNFADIKNKLATLDATRDESLLKAEKHAQEIKEGILREAIAVSDRVREDAKLTVNLEVQRAQKELRDQLLKDSVEAARQALTTNIAAADQQKLQKDFINHVGV